MTKRSDPFMTRLRRDLAKLEAQQHTDAELIKAYELVLADLERRYPEEAGGMEQAYTRPGGAP